MRFPRFAKFGGAIRDLLTAKDGITYAPSRVYWCLAALQFLGLAGWAVVVQDQPFNATDYGTGMAAILVAGGAGVWLTQRTEPGGQG